jgi:hypothetical protein
MKAEITARSKVQGLRFKVDEGRDNGQVQGTRFKDDEGRDNGQVQGARFQVQG